ncbi:hypothetical protein ACWEQ8_34565, partial [Streptomyces noursei]
MGSLYNGQGNADAQHNAQAGGPASSTGNAAAWFAGNGHPAALTGIKTQDLKLSQQGTGGYRQFLIDDTAGEASARLYTTDHNSGRRATPPSRPPVRPAAPPPGSPRP